VRTPTAGGARRLITVTGLACCAAVVAACGSSPSPGASPAATTGPADASSAPPTTAPSQPGPSAAPSPSAPTGPAACTSTGLQIAVPASKGNAAAGSSYFPVEFTNTSASTCTLYGYPGVSFVSGIGGSQIGIPATENPAVSRKLITLAPGQTAHAELQVVGAGNYPPSSCGLVTAHWLKIYPPNQTAPLYASFTAQACSKSKTILTVQTVQPGAG
jgi:Protein of unknown function (DUF4232)